MAAHNEPFNSCVIYKFWLHLVSFGNNDSVTSGKVTGSLSMEWTAAAAVLDLFTLMIRIRILYLRELV